jgi:hypothetical protein
MKIKMKKLLLINIAALTFASTAPTQEIAPGWRATGHWQCGPVRIITSQPINGSTGLDFYVIGAWFDNHFTLYQGDTLYYNGVRCAAVAYPWPRTPPRLNSKQTKYERWCTEEIKRTGERPEDCGE